MDVGCGDREPLPSHPRGVTAERYAAGMVFAEFASAVEDTARDTQRIDRERRRNGTSVGLRPKPRVSCATCGGSSRAKGRSIPTSSEAPSAQGR